MTDTRERVLVIARRWIGTPYRHQGSTEGVGCDCLGLVRGIWRELYGDEPETAPPYAPDWAERPGEERLLSTAARHFRPLSGFGEAEPGDLLLFRFRPQFSVKHAGILDEDGYFIHAYEQAGVIRAALVQGYRRRVAGCYQFPEPSI